MLPKLSHIVVAFLSLLLFCIPLMGCSRAPQDYPPCVTEESGPEFSPCHWDADVRGNQTGQSFTNR